MLSCFGMSSQRFVSMKRSARAGVVLVLVGECHDPGADGPVRERLVGQERIDEILDAAGGLGSGSVMGEIVTGRVCSGLARCNHVEERKKLDRRLSMMCICVPRFRL